MTRDMKKFGAVVGAAVWSAVAFGGTTVSLDGTWRLDYFPQPDGGAVRTPAIPAHETVEAKVPGNCELDLVRAGILPEPEVGLNVLRLRPYEGYQWLYTRTFDAPPCDGKAGERATLVFEGIDTLADVFLNGERIGEAENMLIPQRFDVTKRLKKGENVVQVLIRPVLLDAQNRTIGVLGYCMDGGADGEPYRKAGHMGGWDIFPRAFVSGLWRSVRLEVEDACRIDQVAWLVTEVNPEAKAARVGCRARFQAPFRHIGHADVRFSVSRNGACVHELVKRFNGYHAFSQIHGAPVKDVAFWWPRGWGEPALYDAAVELVADDGTVLARNVQKIGFRSIRLENRDTYPDRPGQFLFRVNGQPCYIRGTNWVPLDSLHGRDREHLLPTLELVKDLNCNMIRIWGGGVYEPEELWDWCDANGVMVWQDFMTGCSVFPQDDRYAQLTREEVLDVVLRHRNRASLALWSGNNENDGAFYWKMGFELGKRYDPNRDRNSRVTIPSVIWEHDPMHDYLPSSPYVSPDVYAEKAIAPESHLWGARGYYKVPFYTNSPCFFASEMGYHGCPNRASLERMMTKGCVYPWTKVTGTDPLKDFHWNDEWQTKASNPFGADPKSITRTGRNSLMTKQVNAVFGSVPTDLDDFIWQSQFVQGEAMKTFVEQFRGRKFRGKNGLIWWNVRDGWPQISDAVVDYWGGRKRAYETIRMVQQDELVMLYDDHRAVAVNDRLYPVKGHATFTDHATGKVLLDTDYEVAANATADLGTVPFSGQGVVDIAYTCDGLSLRNYFLYGEPPFDVDKVKEWVK